MLKFPDDFKQTAGEFIPDSKNWVAVKANKGFISVFYNPLIQFVADVTTYELLDHEWDTPRGHQTVEQINEYLLTIS